MFAAGPSRSEGADVDALVGVLRAFIAVDLDACDSAGLASATSMLRRLRGFLDDRAVRIAHRAGELHAAGMSAAPQEVMATAGRMGAEAGRVVRRADVLADAPVMAGALASGSISADHADTLVNATATLDPTVKEAVLAHDGALAKVATRSTPERFTAHCRRLVNELTADDGLGLLERQRRQTRVRRWVDEATGMYCLEGRFDPETGIKIWTAIDLEVDALRANPNDSGAVDDLARDNSHVAAHALARLTSTGHRERRPGVAELCVHIDDRTLRHGLHESSVCELTDGTEIPVGVARRLACEAEIIPIVYGGASEVLDVGRGQRLANRAQRRAARKMYGTCAVGECTVPFDHCHLHHIVPWHRGGRTDLANLIPLCTRHHHLVHEGGWIIRLDDERTLHLSRPDGTLHASYPLEHNAQRPHRGRRRRPAHAPPHGHDNRSQPTDDDRCAPALALTGA